jgi:hypothetical protein
MRESTLEEILSSYNKVSTQFSLSLVDMEDK